MWLYRWPPHQGRPVQMCYFLDSQFACWIIYWRPRTWQHGYKSQELLAGREHIHPTSVNRNSVVHPPLLPNNYLVIKLPVSEVSLAESGYCIHNIKQHLLHFFQQRYSTSQPSTSHHPPPLLETQLSYTEYEESTDPKRTAHGTLNAKYEVCKWTCYRKCLHMQCIFQCPVHSLAVSCRCASLLGNV